MDQLNFEEDGITYEINQNNLTAKATGSEAKRVIFIPRSVDYHNQNYIVTEIGPKAFEYNMSIECIEFPSDSEITSFGENSFAYSSIKKIFIPSHLKELRHGWCSHTWQLKKVKILPDNPNFKFLDDKQKIMIGKSEPNDDEFNCIFYAKSSIKNISIPSNIKSISPFAFSGCNKLHNINIQKNSLLQKIGDSAFSSTSLKQILITSHVKEIGNGAFEECNYLEKVFFCENSELEKIGKKAFSSTAIESISIPPSVSFIDEEAFFECQNLKFIFFTSSCKINAINKYTFSHNSLENITIPDSVVRIEEGAFYDCNKINTVKFTPNSELKIICKDALKDSSIESLYIPPKLEEMQEGWCSGTYKLNYISMSPDNQNFLYLDDKMLIGKSKIFDDDFDVLLFVRRDIKSIAIPSFIKKISSNSFDYCEKLQNIVFPEDSKLNEIGDSAFSNSGINAIKIPRHVKKICEYAFANCQSLKEVIIDDDSELVTIGSFSFAHTSIESFYIPQYVESLSDGLFLYAMKLNEIIISPNNKNFAYMNDNHDVILGKTDISNDYFDSISIVLPSCNDVYVPSSIKKINSYAFYEAYNINMVGFDEDSELELIGESAFMKSSVKCIALPNKLNKIDKFAFMGCANLKYIHFPLFSKNLICDKNAFTAASFQNICVHSSLCSLEKNAFSFCHNFVSAEFLGDKIILEAFCFINSSNLMLVSFPNASSVSLYSSSFEGCNDNLSIFVIQNAIHINYSTFL